MALFMWRLKKVFLLDVVELLNVNSISLDQFIEKYLDLIVQLNQEILKNQLLPENKRDKLPIYKKYNNRLEFVLNGDIFKFEFYFDYNKMKLVVVHFDKIVIENQITKWWDSLIPISMITTILYLLFCRNPKDPQRYSLYGLLTINVGHLLLFIVLRKCKRVINKNNKVIWVNKDSLDLFRKWFRNRSVPDTYKMYFFLNWLNMWLFALLILALPNPKCQYYVGIMLFVIIFVLFIAVIGIGYLLRIFNLNYWSTSLLTSIIFLIGFIGKDYWSFVALVFVIVNQVLSKDILYLATNINLSRKQGLEHYISTFEGRENEIRLRFQTNVVITFLYLFLIIFNESKFLKPLLLFISPDFPQNNLTNYLLTGIERIVVLVLLYMVLKSPKFRINQSKDKIQILINYVASKLYRNAEESIPTFRDKIQLYKNERIDPAELINNLSIIPSDAKVYWIREPNWETGDTEIEVEVGVVYSDRSLYTHVCTLYREL
ncbi:hypothetical protein ACWOFH_05330 [Aerococcus christensenii]|uniref:Uncharacterized protein n=2 Tax=Aerococcus christensenii TaxID=87541 RepID=A0A133Y4R9_9LACT|nr:hypothetical protein HMPREF3187_00109 [Aerococcus christensenii]